MFSEVDESLRSLLIADVPLDPASVDITFERPTREWSSRLSRPTVNLFLADVRERTE
ncbi:MAG: Pvc16 family protein, partial [Dehalococcoidia bacterium]